MSPWLWIGSEIHSQDLDLLKSLHITHILNCALEVDCKFQRDFEYLHLKREDHSDERISDLFAQSVAFIETAAKQETGRVLVHCRMGISRSASMVVAYLLHTGMSLESALELVKSKRPCAKPNAGFISQLQVFAASLGRRSAFSSLVPGASLSATSKSFELLPSK